MLKVCARCRIAKGHSDFPIDPRRPSRLYSYCLQCKRDYMREYRAADPERAKAKWTADNIKRYGITPETYRDMLDAQGGVCAICKGLPTGNHGRLAIDHDAETGKVRGLLCGKCNMGIGALNHQAELLHEAALYLERIR